MRRTVEEGDIFLTSDPYKCGGAISHSADWLVLLPIYYSDGRLIGWAAMLGHMSDVGGKVPRKPAHPMRPAFLKKGCSRRR